MSRSCLRSARFARSNGRLLRRAARATHDHSGPERAQSQRPDARWSPGACDRVVDPVPRGMASGGEPRPAEVDLDLPALLTPEDVSAFLNVPRRTVYQWIDSGLLPSYRVGPRLIRIFRQDVLTLLQRLPVSDELGADTSDEDRKD